MTKTVPPGRSNSAMWHWSFTF